MLRAVSGDPEGAHQSFSQAWDRANEASARIADYLALIAFQADDPVLELEARRQAVESSPSPERRAGFARALFELDRPAEAQQVLGEPTALPDFIAAGAVAAALGDSRRGRELLLHAAQELPQAGAVEDSWKMWLKDLLVEQGELGAAIDVQRVRCADRGASGTLLLELARLQSNAGDHAAAASSADLALALDPGSDPAQRTLAEALQKAGDPARALAHWQQIGSRDAQSWLDVSRCAIEAGQPAIARKFASSVLQDNPESIEAQVLIGRAHVIEADFEAARTYLERAVEQAPAQPEAWIGLAEAQAACGDGEAAGETLQKAVLSVPGDGRVQMARARWLRSQGQLSQALEHARIAVGIAPGESGWRIEQAEILRDLGQVDQAIPELRAALAAQPGNWRAREALALAYEMKGELPSAAHVLRRMPDEIKPASALNAGRILVKASANGGTELAVRATGLLVAAREQGLDDDSLWYWLARAYEQSGLDAQAVEAFQAFLEEAGGAAHELKLEGFIGCARTALQTAQVERAITTLEEGLREFPASQALVSTLAKTYLSCSRFPEAEQAAQQSVELEPSDLESKQVLRQAMFQQGKHQQAIALQESLIAANPQDADAFRTLAVIEHADGLLEAAEKHLAHAIQLGRRESALGLELAETAADFGRVRLAQRVLKQSARLDPERADVLFALAETSESLGDLETAQASWLQYASLRTKDHEPLERAADALWRLGRRTAAIGLRERALEISGAAEQHLALADALRITNRVEHAAQHYHAAAEKAAGNPDVLAAAGAGLYELNRVEEAEGVLSNAPAGSPDVAAVRAWLDLARGDLDAARKHVKSVPADAPGQQRLRTIELQIAHASGQVPAVETGLDQAPASDDECTDAVRAFLAVNEWDQAVALLDRYLANHPLTDHIAAWVLALAHRLHDIDWLFTIACDAPGHGPSAALAQVEILQQRLAQQPAGPAPSTELMLEIWQALQSGETGNVTIERIAGVPKSFQPMLFEAASIALIKSNRPTRALELLDTISGVPMDAARGALLAGIAESMSKHYEAAVETLDMATADAMLQPLAFYLQSEAYRKAGRGDDSLHKLNAALAIWPDEAAWQFVLAERYLVEEKIDAALPHLQHAVELEPSNGEYQLALARTYRQVGQVKDALACFAYGLQSAPKSPVVWKEAGEAALEAGDLASAEAWLERACTLAPSDALCAIQSARTALARGDMKAAMKRGQAAVRMQPESAQVLSGMGEILAADGKVEKAIQMYDLALKSSEEHLPIRLARGKLLAQSGRSSEAAAELEAIVKAAPDHDQAWGELARAYVSNGSLGKALEAANEAVKLSPRDIRHMLLLGKVCRLNGQLDRALSVLSEAGRLAPEQAAVARELGKVHEMRREHGPALDAYQRALAIDPDDSEALIEAGLILKAIKAYDQAGELFERAVKLNPVDPQALQQLATIRALQLIHGGTRETEAVPS